MPQSSRPDLGALLNQLLVVIRAREEPILAARGLSMWDYVILAALAATAAPTQARLAAITGRDKTRLIDNLDRLEQSDLLRRRPDPADRRNRIVELTADGRAILQSCRTAVRAMEHDLLAAVPASRRTALRHDLVAITTAAHREARRSR